VRSRSYGALILLFVFICYCAFAQTSSSGDEIPIDRCDVLPVVKVRIAGREMRFLLDTGATSILNVRSFKTGKSTQIHVESWHGSAATSAVEVTLSNFQLGSHELHDLKLPAIDLSPIAKACGGEIDGILGVDLLDRMGITIDLQRKVAVFQPPPEDVKARFAAMEEAMHPCNLAFDQGKAEVLEQCFDPDIVLYTQHGEFVGRRQVMKYLTERYLKYAPNLRYDIKPHEVQSFGDALWYSYDYSIDTPKEHIAGHGMSVCRRIDGRWRVLNLHNSILEK
jgi:hypothetical protein